MEIEAASFAAFLQFGVIGAITVLFILVSLKRPWFGTLAALICLPMVPPWVGLSIGSFFLSVHMVVLLTATIATLATRPNVPRSGIVDITLLVILAFTWIGIPMQLTTVVQGYTFLLYMIAFWFGRVTIAAYGIRRLATAIAIVACVTAVLLLFEFVSGMNLWITYVHFDNQVYLVWSDQQTRGGIVRAEGAFGHSIAAGCSIALAAVISLEAKLRPWLRILILALLAAATLATVSRSGIVTLAFGLCLTLVFGRTSLSKRLRLAIAGLLAGGVAVYAATLAEVFSTAGAEASNSAAYRFWLLDLLPSLRPLGYAAGVWRSTGGDLTFGSFRSIDNALLYFALTNGWLPTLLLVVLMLAAVVRVVRFQAGVATIALVATLPALFTVALITQYALVFWVVVGLAASERVPTRPPEEVRSDPPSAAPLRQQLETAAELKESRQC